MLLTIGVGPALGPDTDAQDGVFFGYGKGEIPGLGCLRIQREAATTAHQHRIVIRIEEFKQQFARIGLVRMVLYHGRNRDIVALTYKPGDIGSYHQRFGRYYLPVDLAILQIFRIGEGLEQPPGIGIRDTERKRNIAGLVALQSGIEEGGLVKIVSIIDLCHTGLNLGFLGYGSHYIEAHRCGIDRHVLNAICRLGLGFRFCKGYHPATSYQHSLRISEIVEPQRRETYADITIIGQIPVGCMERIKLYVLPVLEFLEEYMPNIGIYLVERCIVHLGNKAGHYRFAGSIGKREAPFFIGSGYQMIPECYALDA